VRNTAIPPHAVAQPPVAAAQQPASWSNGRHFVSQLWNLLVAPFRVQNLTLSHLACLLVVLSAACTADILGAGLYWSGDLTELSRDVDKNRSHLRVNSTHDVNATQDVNASVESNVTYRRVVGYTYDFPWHGAALLVHAYCLAIGLHQLWFSRSLRNAFTSIESVIQELSAEDNVSATAIDPRSTVMFQTSPIILRQTLTAAPLGVSDALSAAIEESLHAFDDAPAARTDTESVGAAAPAPPDVSRTMHFRLQRIERASAPGAMPQQGLGDAIPEADALSQAASVSRGSPVAAAPATSTVWLPWRELRRWTGHANRLLGRPDRAARVPPPALVDEVGLPAFLSELHSATSQLGVCIGDLQMSLLEPSQTQRTSQLHGYAANLDLASEALQSFAAALRTATAGNVPTSAATAETEADARGEESLTASECVSTEPEGAAACAEADVQRTHGGALPSDGSASESRAAEAAAI